MKSKSNFTLMVGVAVLVFGFQLANAQSWSLSGNSNATTSSRLGTKNAIPLRLSTNNLTRLFIDASTGNVGIGTGDNSILSYKLQVTGGAYGIYGFGSTYGLFGSGDYGVYGAGNTVGTYGTGVFGLYGVGTSTGVYGTGAYSGLNGFSTDGMGVIGESTTGYGVQGFSNYLGVYGSGGTYGLYGLGDSFAGVFGYSCCNYGLYGSSGYLGVYGSGNSYGLYGYSSGGNGIRGASDINDGAYFTSYSAYGMRAGTTTGFYAGVFDGSVYTFGGYYSSSDENLKKNIKDVDNAMSIINRLKPKNYEFRTDDKFATLNLPKGTHYGLIAQEVEEVLPNLVKESPQKIGSEAEEVIKPVTVDGKTPTAMNEQGATKVEPGNEEMNIMGVNYEELIPILIKGMQELSKQNDDLQQQVNALKAASSQSSQLLNVSSESSLDQNAPNPFTAATSISYTLPQQYDAAKIVITDQNSKTLKEIIISGSGKGSVSIDTSTLSSGTYQYSLYVNGKLIDTKQMVLIK